MTDGSDIIDRIDAATGCQQCGGPLGLSPSGDFCAERCQRAWTAKKAMPLPDPPDRLAVVVLDHLRMLTPTPELAVGDPVTVHGPDGERLDFVVVDVGPDCLAVRLEG